MFCKFHIFGLQKYIFLPKQRYAAIKPDDSSFFSDFICTFAVKTEHYDTYKSTQSGIRAEHCHCGA